MNQTVINSVFLMQLPAVAKSYGADGVIDVWGALNATGQDLSCDGCHVSLAGCSW